MDRGTSRSQPRWSTSNDSPNSPHETPSKYIHFSVDRDANLLGSRRREHDGAKSHGATAELIDGMPFSRAAIMLFHGVALLMESVRERVAKWAAQAVAAVLRRLAETGDGAYRRVETRRRCLGSEPSLINCEHAGCPYVGMLLPR